jgi:hypothetical protein
MGVTMRKPIYCYALYDNQGKLTLNHYLGQPVFRVAAKSIRQAFYQAHHHQWRKHKKSCGIVKQWTPWPKPTSL